MLASDFDLFFCLYITSIVHCNSQYLRERRGVSDVGMVQPPSKFVGQEYVLQIKHLFWKVLSLTFRLFVPQTKTSASRF